MPDNSADTGFEADIKNFLAELIENEIIFDTEAENSGQEGSLDVLDDIQNLCTENRLLFSACLELTYRCNEKCIHCFIDDAPPDDRLELNFEDYKNILQQLRALGCIYLLVTGGEPSLKSCFMDVCSYAKDLGFIVNIYTNGLNISDELFEKMAALKPNSISVSMYGGDAQTHDAVTQIKGSFDKTLNTVLKLKCAGIDTFIKCSVLKNNFDNIEKLFKLGSLLGIDVTPSLLVTDTHNLQDRKSLALDTKGEYEEFYEMYSKYDFKAPVDFSQVKRNIDERVCAAGQYTLSIAPDGNVYPCNSFPLKLGNVRKNKIKDIWENSAELQELRKFKFRSLSPECGECEYSSACAVCLGASYIENDKKLMPCRTTCMAAKAKFESRKEAVK